MAEGAPFGRRLVEATTALGPLCAGIDPSPALLGAWGLDDDAAGLGAFGARCVDALRGAVAVVKPQVAFFERHGAAGLGALEETMSRARDAGMLVIADAKRGDIDSTAAAYADAWLDDASPLAADAVTVHPYLGVGARGPFFATAAATGRGVFVVVRSSNPEGRPLQEARTAAGPSVEDGLLADLAGRNAAWARAAGAQPPLGPFGAVVGATLAPSAFSIADLGGPILAPGVGAQGAAPADLRARFAGCPPGSVLANVSRSLLASGPDAGALREAALRLQSELSAASL
jgi:orotidine-5'-phosphate decarboxylase